jgi:Ca2+-binding EF-hand superfamily protein
MSKNKFTGSALIVAAVLMGAAAFAQDSGMGPGGMPRGAGPKFDFSAMDADKDGKVTKAEIEAFRAARFAQADANKDGSLSPEEMAAAHDSMMAQRKADREAKMFKRMDKDGNGLISQDEMPIPPNADKMFDRMDTDGDGAISQAELDAAQQKMQERRDARGHHKGGHGQDGHGHGHGDAGQGN